MRMMSRQNTVIAAVLLVVSLSAGAAMVFGEAEKDKDKDTSSIGGGSLGMLELGKGNRTASHDDLGAGAAFPRSGWVIPAEGLMPDGAALSTWSGVGTAWPTGMTVREGRPEWRPRRTSSTTGPHGGGGTPVAPLPDPRTTVTIPEPATLSLLSLGGLAMFVRHRRRC